MHIDRERQQELERQRDSAEAEIREQLSGPQSPAQAEALRALRDRVRAIEEELTRMEFAIEMERQSDA